MVLIEVAAGLGNTKYKEVETNQDKVQVHQVRTSWIHRIKGRLGMSGDPSYSIRLDIDGRSTNTVSLSSRDCCHKITTRHSDVVKKHEEPDHH